ncbi:MAG TPA: hypothetical protein VHH11_20110, partial [Gammaproteobacteria bacterium]|nr:hypothetical protein [Gammaproteobacteria bacterium]
AAAARPAATRGAAKAPETATASNASTPAPPAAPITGVTVRQAPAAAPAAPAKPAASPVVENAIALLRGKVPQYRILDQVHRSNQPHTLTGDERARLEDAGASERLLQAIEKPADIKLEEMQPPRSSPANRQAIVACQRKAAQDNPRDAQARIQAIRACMTN